MKLASATCAVLAAIFLTGCQGSAASKSGDTTPAITATQRYVVGDGQTLTQLNTTVSDVMQNQKFMVTGGYSEDAGGSVRVDCPGKALLSVGGSDEDSALYRDNKEWTSSSAEGPWRAVPVEGPLMPIRDSACGLIGWIKVRPENQARWTASVTQVSADGVTFSLSGPNSESATVRIDSRGRLQKIDDNIGGTASWRFSDYGAPQPIPSPR